MALDGFLSEIRSKLSGELLTDEKNCSLYASDLLKSSTCGAVIKPVSEKDVQAVVRAARSHDMKIFPRGGGFTYSSGYTPDAENAVMLDMSVSNKIIEINERDMYIHVEAGVTWKQIYDALEPKGLRLPFFGTFSGLSATVGGGLSNGALFLGSARYGSVADMVLGMEIVLGTGEIIQTGQLSVKNSDKPFYRVFGPDFNGLFTHDSGRFGIKTKASFRLIRKPKFTDYLSFAFAKMDDMAECTSELGREDLCEEGYVLCPVKTMLALNNHSSLSSDVKALFNVVKSEGSLLGSLKSGFGLVKSGRSFLPEDTYTMHLVLAEKNQAALDEAMKEVRRIAASFGGTEVANSVPKATRANLWLNMNGVVGPEGDRWCAINAKLAHSDAQMVINDIGDIVEAHRSDLDAHKIRVSFLYTILSNNCFSFEPVFNWYDDLLPLHKHAVEDGYLDKFPMKSDRKATDIVMTVRGEIVDYFYKKGIPSSQIGRSYPYYDALGENNQKLVAQLAKLLDDQSLMNPGALGIN